MQYVMYGWSPHFSGDFTSWQILSTQDNSAVFTVENWIEIELADVRKKAPNGPHRGWVGTEIFDFSSEKYFMVF